MNRDIKKFLIKLFFAGIPIIVYVVLFIVFEPYNYYGLKAEKTGLWSTPLARMREYMRNPSANVILGDSRMNHFDLTYVEEITGKQYVNLSTGGQQLNQTAELYEWAKQKNGIENLVLGISFYQVRSGHMGANLGQTIYIAEHPLDYIVTRDYVVEAYSYLAEEIIGKDDKETVERDTNVNDGIALDGRYKESIERYAKESILPACYGYTVGDEQMGYALSIIKDMYARDIEVIVVVPPVHSSIWEYVLYPLEITDEIDSYKSVLSEYSLVRDMEEINQFTLDENNYRDGFHLVMYNEDGSMSWQNKIFTDNVFGISEELIRD